MLKKIAKYFLRPLLKRVSKLEANNIALNKRVTRLEALVDEFSNGPDKIWLYKNKGERMDATLEGEAIFADIRKRFHLARYQFACNYTHGKVVADIACGTGYGTELMAQKGAAKQCLGVDIAKEAIDYAEKYHNPSNTEFYCASADHTPFNDESLDVVASFETIEHLPDDVSLLSEFHRILKSNGQLIISTPNMWPLSMMDHHTKEYDYQEFKRVLEDAGFTIEKMYNQNSGHDWEYNRSQSEGIIETTEQNHHLAECFIAVCKK